MSTTIDREYLFNEKIHFYTILQSTIKTTNKIRSRSYILLFYIKKTKKPLLKRWMKPFCFRLCWTRDFKEKYWNVQLTFNFNCFNFNYSFSLVFKYAIENQLFLKFHNTSCIFFSVYICNDLIIIKINKIE